MHEKDNYLKTAELSTEQNCNMIDGVPNNTPIQPTPPELDAKPLDSNHAVSIIYLLLQTCYRSRISKETPGVYRSRCLFAYSMQRRFRVFRAFALTDTPMYSTKPLLFPIQATLLTFLPVFESAAELK